MEDGVYRPGQRSLEERLQIAERKLSRGINIFHQSDIERARICFKNALRYLTEDFNAKSNSEAVADSKLHGQDESNLYTKRLDLIERCGNNYAAALTRIQGEKNNKEAMRITKQVLTYRPKSLKALYRAGKLYAAEKDYGVAEIFLKRALSVDPQNKAIANALQRVSKSKRVQKKKNVKRWQKVIEGGDMYIDKKDASDVGTESTSEHRGEQTLNPAVQTSWSIWLRQKFQNNFPIVVIVLSLVIGMLLQYGFEIGGRHRQMSHARSTANYKYNPIKGTFK